MTTAACSKGVWYPGFYTVLKGVAVKNDSGQIELFHESSLLLGAQVGGENDENPPLLLCPHLGDNQVDINGYAKVHLVRQNGTLHEREMEREQRRFHLMRVEINPRVGKGGRQLFITVAPGGLREDKAHIFRVKIRELHEPVS